MGEDDTFKCGDCHVYTNQIVTEETNSVKSLESIKVNAVLPYLNSNNSQISSLAPIEESAPSTKDSGSLSEVAQVPPVPSLPFTVAPAPSAHLEVENQISDYPDTNIVALDICCEECGQSFTDNSLIKMHIST